MRQLIAALVLAVAAACLALPLAWSDEAKIPPAEHKSLQDFADANKDCDEWSDGCAVCVRRDHATFVCSLPGIACLPSSLACRSPAGAK